MSPSSKGAEPRVRPTASSPEVCPRAASGTSAIVAKSMLRRSSRCCSSVLLAWMKASSIVYRLTSPTSIAVACIQLTSSR
jgi:hypothetical protein